MLYCRREVDGWRAGRYDAKPPGTNKTCACCHPEAADVDREVDFAGMDLEPLPADLPGWEPLPDARERGGRAGAGGRWTGGR